MCSLTFSSVPRKKVARKRRVDRFLWGNQNRKECNLMKPPTLCSSLSILDSVYMALCFRTYLCLPKSKHLVAKNGTSGIIFFPSKYSLKRRRKNMSQNCKTSMFFRWETSAPSQLNTALKTSVFQLRNKLPILDTGLSIFLAHPKSYFTIFCWLILANAIVQRPKKNHFLLFICRGAG